MKFEITVSDCQPTAIAIAEYFKGNDIRVKIETNAWDDQPFRTTLLGQKQGLIKFIEVKSVLKYEDFIRNFAHWLGFKRHYAEFYIGIPRDTTIHVGTMSEMKKDGVGLLIVDENGHVEIDFKAKNHALVVTPEPALSFGAYKTEVDQCVAKFNNTDRKDGLRDMCEIVERETDKLFLKASRKGWLKLPESECGKKDWSTKINYLASQDQYNVGYQPLFNDNLKTDMQSFRGARNLVDHRVLNQRDNKKRELQFTERMVQGPRLFSELLSLQRKIK